MLAREQAQAATPADTRRRALPGKAKHVISLFLSGGPSQVDMFDPKPALVKYRDSGRAPWISEPSGRPAACCPRRSSSRSTARAGSKSASSSRNLASVIDDICVIRSMYSFNPTHTPALQPVSHGHGASEPAVDGLVGFLRTGLREREPALVCRARLGIGGRRLGGSATRAGFLPAEHQGTPFNDAEVEPEKMIPDLRNKWLDKDGQRRQLDAMQALNREYSHPSAATSISKAASSRWKSAYRMQFAAIDAFDIRKEPEAIREEYGTTPFANGCLLARRLVERGVRYVHVYGAGGWDDHKDIEKNYRKKLSRHGSGRRGV